MNRNKEEKPASETVRRVMNYEKDIYDMLLKRKEETGHSVTKQVRRAIRRELGIEASSRKEVPVLGYIPASPASAVVHLPPGTIAYPPFDLDKDCYGLIVTGDSMTADHGLSVPSGSYAFFCPGVMPHFGSLVHVEFPRDDGEHDCTLKRFCPDIDGKSIRFEPLNKDYDAILKKEGEYVIKGVFVRAWGAEAQKEES